MPARTPAAAALARWLISRSPRRRRRRSGTSAESATSPFCRTTPARGRSGTKSLPPASWRAGCSRHPQPSAMRCSRPSPRSPSNDTLAGLIAEAGRLQQQKRYDAVLDALGLQVRLARTLGDLDSEGRGLIQTGSLRMMTGGFPEAGEAFSAAREAFATLGQSRRGGRVRRQPGQPRVHAGPLRRSRRDDIRRPTRSSSS